MYLYAHNKIYEEEDMDLKWEYMLGFRGKGEMFQIYYNFKKCFSKQKVERFSECARNVTGFFLIRSHIYD